MDRPKCPVDRKTEMAIISQGVLFWRCPACDRRGDDLTPAERDYFIPPGQMVQRNGDLVQPEKECNCLQLLDELRLDHESGKVKAFLVAVVYNEPNKKGEASWLWGHKINSDFKLWVADVAIEDVRAERAEKS